MKKVLRALPHNSRKKKQVVESVARDLGLLSKRKATRTSVNLPPTLIEKVQKFYASNDISWQAPGKRDTKTVKENGTKVQYQKRYLLYSISEVFELFIEQNPGRWMLYLKLISILLFTIVTYSHYVGMSISRSSFAKSRPKHVVYKRTLPHRSCLCVAHENIHLLLKALSGEINGLETDLSQFTSKMVCNDTNENCMLSKCAICKGNFVSQIVDNILDAKKKITWDQWVTSNNRVEKKDFHGMSKYLNYLFHTSVYLSTGTVLQCVKELQNKTPQYLFHVFVKRKQSNFFEHIKENADGGTVVCQVDYSENFTLHEQDQIQLSYWSNRQISLFTAYAWMGGSGGEGYSFGLVANSTKHDKYSVITCLEVLIRQIADINPDIDQIIFFSDGAASQFKNRFLVQHLSTLADTSGLDLSWNYFASSHGKGLVDSIGGTLKRIVWLQILAGTRCRSASDFVRICRDKTKTIIVELIQQAQFDVTEGRLERTFRNLVGVPDIRRQHHINILHKDVIEYALYSTREEKYVFRF